MIFEKVEVQPAYQLVASNIEKCIMQGVYKVGQQLPSELDLARQLGVNRSTVREAIRVLEQNGLVFRKSARRLVISLPREQDLASRVSQAMILHEITFLELWETMLPLEVRAAELAATRAELATLQGKRWVRWGLDLTAGPAWRRWPAAALAALVGLALIPVFRVNDLLAKMRLGK